MHIGDVEFKFVLPTATDKKAPANSQPLSSYQLSPSRKSAVCESAAVAEAANNDNDTAPFDETTKPPFLIHQLILNAIRASPPGCTGLSYHQITLMIQKLYPYYGSTACKEDWKPAVKFNLVHNKMFTKITSPATANGSKKRKWVIDEHYLFERQRQLNEEQGEVPTTTPSAENETYNQLSRYELPVPAATSPIHSKSSRRNSSNNSSIRARRDSLSQDPGYIKFIKMLKAAYFKALAKHNPADISPDAGPFIKLVLRTLRARHMDLERLLLKAYTLEDPQAQRQLLSVVKMVLRRTLDGNSASTSPARKASGVNQGPKLVHVWMFDFYVSHGLIVFFFFFFFTTCILRLDLMIMTTIF